MKDYVYKRHVYILTHDPEWPDDIEVKIGVSTNPESRRRIFSASARVQLFVAKSWPFDSWTDAICIEQMSHSLLHHCRRGRTEWFDTNAETATISIEQAIYMFLGKRPKAQREYEIAANREAGRRAGKPPGRKPKA